MPRKLIYGSSTSSPCEDPGFVQQGEVEWVSLSKTVVSFTVGTLMRLSSAGIQEITYVGALQLATRFKLADIGYRRVYEAIQSTQFAPAFGNVVFFGFGYRSFIHFLADSVSGVKCIALCGCLAEGHSEEYAARVISSLWGVVGFPEDFQPSLMQFRCLTKACAGVFAKTAFGETMKIMLGSHRNFDKEGNMLQASEPEATAKALHALFNISTGALQRITVVGGAECSFIAAVSHWLFDFKIQVENKQGDVLFVSSPGPEQTQVHILYKDDDQLSKVMVSSSTFVLAKPSDLLRVLPDVHLRFVRTRTHWENCLSQTFGQEFEDLLSLSTALGRLFGGAARISQALARGECDILQDSRWHFINFVESSYGRGFIQSMGVIFPELNDTHLFSCAQSILSLNVQGARSSIGQALCTFRHQCVCQNCYEKADNGPRTGPPRGLFCLVTLAVTLLDLVFMLSSVEYDQRLLPTEYGLLRTYWQVKATIPSLHEVELIMESFKLTSSICKNWSGNLAKEMASLVLLFTGYSFEESHELGEEQTLYNNRGRTAVAVNGICVYLDCLESITMRPEVLRRIHVIPGQIWRGDRNYESIRDCAHIPPPIMKKVDITTTAESGDPGSEDTSLNGMEMSVLVDEPSRPDQLTFTYQMSTGADRVFLQPWMITYDVLSKSGLIPCSRSDCEKSTGTNVYYIHSGWTIDTQVKNKFEVDVRNKRDVLVWKHPVSDKARLLAMWMQRSSKDSIVLRQDECLSCSILSAFQIAYDPQEKTLAHII